MNGDGVTVQGTQAWLERCWQVIADCEDILSRPHSTGEARARAKADARELIAIARGTIGRASSVDPIAHEPLVDGATEIVDAARELLDYADSSAHELLELLNAPHLKQRCSPEILAEIDERRRHFALQVFWVLHVMLASAVAVALVIIFSSR